VAKKLTHEEAVAMVEKWNAYGKALGTTYWKDNKQWGSREEFMLAAQEGLWMAAVRFEPDRGLKFTTFSLYQIRRCCQELIRSHGGSPQDQTRQRPLSLDYDQYPTLRGFGRFCDLIPDRDEREESDIPADFWDRVNSVLHPRLQELVRLRFRENLTLVEIGKRFGVSKGRVHQLEQQAIQRLSQFALLTN